MVIFLVVSVCSVRTILTFESVDLETSPPVGSAAVRIGPLRFLTGGSTRAHDRDEKTERDMTYHLTCSLIYHGTTTHL